jgi:hypothetical protein
MNPLEIFQKEAPEVARAFDGLIEALKGLASCLPTALEVYDRDNVSY